MNQMHFAVRDEAAGRHRRACNSRVRYRRPNEDTDTALREDVTCIRCRGTKAWRKVVE